MAGTYRFKIDQGATLRRILVWKKEDGTPVDLTDYTARMEIRDQAGGVLLYRLDTDNGGLTLGGEAGTITLHIPAATSTPWAWRAGVYDLELIAPNGDVVRLIQGGLQVVPEVTTGA
ncbi:hypothetical protein [Acrocarpospora sp. B8E8]|uniref:hypothetical protein n=1 Tax=Acrocarpospora sp. B8E8 TaxID=3153572 RepID=UPI00325ED29B